MPTSLGLPKAGEMVRHKPSGDCFRIVKREGNDAMYSLILTPVDGSALPRTVRTAYGYTNAFRLLEAGYYLTQFFELVPGS